MHHFPRLNKTKSVSLCTLNTRYIHIVYQVKQLSTSSITAGELEVKIDTTLVPASSI